MNMAERVRQNAVDNTEKVFSLVKEKISAQLFRSTQKSGCETFDIVDVAKHSGLRYDRTDMRERVTEWLISEGFVVSRLHDDSLAIQRGDSSGFRISVSW